jgi:hypothetical protein
MQITDLVVSAQIRGVLTVSEADLPDETLLAYGLTDDLGENLDSWLTGWELITDNQQTRLLRLYAKYFCAATVAATAPVFVLTKQTDGSNEGQRAGSEGFRWLAGDLRAKAESYRNKLLALVGQSEPAESMTFASRVTPGRDPVTEARSEPA